MSTEETTNEIPPKNNVYRLPLDPSRKKQLPEKGKEKLLFLQVREFLNIANQRRYAVETFLRTDCHGLVVDIRAENSEHEYYLINNAELKLSRTSLTWISLYLKNHSEDRQLIEVIKSKLERRRLDPEIDLAKENLDEFKKLIKACYDFEAIWQRYKQVKYQNPEDQYHSTKYDDLRTLEEIEAEINHLLNTLFSLVDKNLKNIDFFNEFRQIKNRYVEKLAQEKIQKPNHLTLVKS